MTEWGLQASGSPSGLSPSQSLGRTLYNTDLRAPPSGAFLHPPCPQRGPRGFWVGPQIHIPNKLQVMMHSLKITSLGAGSSAGLWTRVREMFGLFSWASDSDSQGTQKSSLEITILPVLSLRRATSQPLSVHVRMFGKGTTVEAFVFIFF